MVLGIKLSSIVIKSLSTQSNSMMDNMDGTSMHSKQLLDCLGMFRIEKLWFVYITSLCLNIFIFLYYYIYLFDRVHSIGTERKEIDKGMMW
jgi:hypothetical protein